jgi:hypothetical protein
VASHVSSEDEGFRDANEQHNKHNHTRKKEPHRPRRLREQLHEYTGQGISDYLGDTYDGDDNVMDHGALSETVSNGKDGDGNDELEDEEDASFEAAKKQDQSLRGSVY